MQLSNAPVKFPAVWAYGASSPYVSAVPTLSQQGIKNGAASLQDGYPPNCFIPYASGGAGPYGDDTNGILQQVTAGIQWMQAGGVILYDGTFQTAIGGYPIGALVASVVYPGLVWWSRADNNATNPDANGVNWAVARRMRLLANTTFYVNASSGSNTTGLGTSGAPWASVQYASDWVLKNVDGAGFGATISLVAGTDTTGLNFAYMAPALSLTLNLTGNIAATNQNAIWCQLGGVLALTGSGEISCTSTNPTHSAIASTNAATIIIPSSSALIIGASPVGLTARAGGSIDVQGGYTVSGGGNSHLFAASGGSIAFDNVAGNFNVTVSGTPAFGTAFGQGFAVAADGGSIEVNAGIGFVGGSTGNRYYCTNAGGCDTNGAGASFFPGDVAGTATPPGYYS